MHQELYLETNMTLGTFSLPAVVFEDIDHCGMQVSKRQHS